MDRPPDLTFGAMLVGLTVAMACALLLSLFYKCLTNAHLIRSVKAVRGSMLPDLPLSLQLSKRYTVHEASCKRHSIGTRDLCCYSRCSMQVGGTWLLSLVY